MKIKEAFKKFLQENCYIDDNGNLTSIWQEGVAFEMSDEVRKIVTKLYYEPSDTLMPPKSSSRKEVVG